MAAEFASDGSSDGEDRVKIDDPLRSWRLKRANRFFNEDLKDQRGWYSKKAGSYKTWHFYTSILIISAGALTVFVQLFEAGPSHVAVITAGLGAIVVLVKGIQDLMNYQENWLSYRKASEGMKREYRLFVNNCGPYHGTTDQEAAFVLFVERIETIIAEEQRLFFNRSHDNSNKDKKDEKAD